jgi:hypothetical protein
VRVTVHPIDATGTRGDPLDEFNVSGYGVAQDIGIRVAAAAHRAPVGSTHIVALIDLERRGA